ncbi:MAG: S-methyl-5-thioribose-1-phosphate isomerase [Gammaproteobacteria bacterium]|nr:S-methyl-5-thioribose-1-phosphate isomerase [Gammaproteobacteria bacterium]
MTDSSLAPVRWDGEALVLLDQRQLPHEETYLRCTDHAEVVAAISTMVVRGAPAIGIAGAFGVVLAARAAGKVSEGRRADYLQAALRALREARPTAVNLAWAVDRMATCLASAGAELVAALTEEAERIFDEDLAANHRMGDLGAALLSPGARVMTHCNAGALATAGYGTALGVIRSAWREGRLAEVFATETRPWLQGARLTAWELQRDGIPVRLITDGSAAHVMRTRGVAWVIVGADRVAANGDVANKIGTYALAVAARYHGARLMVVAPASTVDLSTPSGEAIHIEERTPSEVLEVAGTRFAAPGVEALNPVFDVTPADLVDVLVTERGVLERPDAAGMAALMA